jgi:hypothetical protein
VEVLVLVILVVAAAALEELQFIMHLPLLSPAQFR